MAPSHWDPLRYDTRFSFVSRYGETLIDLLDPQPGERVLDLGCGTGTLLCEIVKRGAEGIGLDADAAMVAAAQAALPGIEILHARGESFQLDELVDGVFSNAVLHWMTNPECVTQRVHAALKPGGRFVADQGGARNTEHVHEALTQAFSEYGYELHLPWYYPSPAEHAAVLEDVGFRVALMEYFPRPTPLEERAGGLGGWLRMFGMTMFDGLPAGDVDGIIARVESLASDDLYRDGVWYVDYWRLRFVAIRDS